MHIRRDLNQALKSMIPSRPEILRKKDKQIKRKKKKELNNLNG